VVSCTLREDVFLRNQEFRLSCLDYERHAVQVTSEVLRSFNQSDDRFQFGVFPIMAVPPDYGDSLRRNPENPL
jgi:hypothetical protein